LLEYCTSLIKFLFKSYDAPASSPLYMNLHIYLKAGKYGYHLTVYM
jgi:hypothetical protein